MALVEAYDTRSGRKYWVRPEAVGHPTAGPHLSLTPRQKARGERAARKPSAAALKKAATKPAESIETPVAGDGKD
jgi:hypothetical protein